MKKFSALFALLALTAILAVPAFSLNIGDPVGNVLYTDIVAKIDGHPIRAFNVNGYMAVVAEDLRDYGFDVVWDAGSRTLVVTSQSSPDPASFAEYIPEPPAGKIGKPAFPVLYTDIVTYVDSRYVESFNIDGQTVIYFRDLRRTGNVEYDNISRTSFYTHGGEPWSVSGKMTSFGDGEPRSATGSNLAAEVRRTGDGMVLNVLSDPGGQVELHVTQKSLRIALFSSPEGDPFYETAFYRAFHALWGMGLPDIMENYLRYDNSPEQRDAVSSRLLVTLNGEVVKGDAWFGYGNGHTDLYFDFDRVVTVGGEDVLRLEVGEVTNPEFRPNENIREKDVKWEDKLAEIQELYNYYEGWRAETDKYLILSWSQRTGRPGNAHFTILYKDGGWTDVADQFPYVYALIPGVGVPDHELVPVDETVPYEDRVFFTLSDDGEYVYFTARSQNSGMLEYYRVSLQEGIVDRVK